MNKMKLIDAVRACGDAKFEVQVFANGTKSDGYLNFTVTYIKRLLIGDRYHSGPEFLFSIDHTDEIVAADFERKLAVAIAKRDAWDADYASQIEARGY